MAATSQAFYCMWQAEAVRERLFEHLSKEDICSVRLASTACCNLVTKRLFLRTHLTFTANTFTKESRVQALLRIGHHIEHLTFYLPHSDATFLPPLIHPDTGREVNFLYTPHTSMASVLSRPKFANNELGEMLTDQYPPLFHAATNVPSFINAMKYLPNMRHLTIKTPGQDPKERYRRDIVDYALISLRISLERAPLKKLKKLSLSSVHPSAFQYLRHVPGFGCTPSAGRRWQQIRKLHISVESWDFYGPSPGLDHLRILDDYIRIFSPCLEKFTFTWLGRKGPCPVALAGDPLFAPPRNSQKLFNEVTSPMSPLPAVPPRKPIMFRKLRYLSVRNATMNVPQVAGLVADHRHCVREFDFENVVLINDGNWDDALAPLMENATRREHWSRYSTGTVSEEIESVESPVAAAAAAAASPLVDDLPSPSAAVSAVSQELLAELDNGEAQLDQQDVEDIQNWASDVEAARKASLSFSTIVKKRRVLKRRRKRKHHDHQEETQKHAQAQHAPEPSRFYHRRQRSKESEKGSEKGSENAPEQGELPPELSHLRHERPRSRLFGEIDTPHSPAQSRHRLFGEIEPPELTHSPTDEAGSIDEYFRPPTPIPEMDMEISLPILDTKPSMPALLQPTVYDPTAGICSEITAVQREIEAEEKQRMLAEDVAMRTSALRKAKAAVLSKLSEHFPGRQVSGRKASGQAGMRKVWGRTGPGVVSSLDLRSMDVPILFSRS